MYSPDRVAEVRALAADGWNQSQIALATDISRTTVRLWLRGHTPMGRRLATACFRCHGNIGPFPELVYSGYAYLLGMYLGDGSISSHGRGVHRLTITLDSAYPVIVAECEAAISLVRPVNRVLTAGRSRERATDVSAYSKHWPCLLPQHGPGMKHQRRIEIEPWQREILDRHPWRFLRGLIHSDGCRVMNPAVHPAKTYWYPRYQFSNRSADIRDLFCEYCDKVGVEWRRSNRWNTSVARRGSVALMDRHIGPKR